MFALLLAAASAACPFTFVGQPSCVEIQFHGETSEVVNRCEGPLLLDQSVVLPRSTPVVSPGDSATIRDLNRFTLAVDGRLHAVLATVPDTCQ